MQRGTLSTKHHLISTVKDLSGLSGIGRLFLMGSLCLFGLRG